MNLKIVCLSDTHMLHPHVEVPDGDILIHAGDFCSSGKERQAYGFADWLGRLPHRHKVVIAGNHDLCLEKDMGLGPRIFGERGIHYLFDSEVTVAGLRIYGSPWQPAFFDWAFNLPRGEKLREIWSRIPKGLDVLVTHGPPRGILDKNQEGEHVGCEDLREAVLEKKPRLHVFGHIHEGYGVVSDPKAEIMFVNASSCNRKYQPVNPPWIVSTGALWDRGSHG